jgi:pilus assembly protein Flp/PilA
MVGRLVRFVRDRRGATAIEYGLIAALVVLAMVGGLTAFSDEMIDMYHNVTSRFITAVEQTP